MLEGDIQKPTLRFHLGVKSHGVKAVIKELKKVYKIFHFYVLSINLDIFESTLLEWALKELTSCCFPALS